MPRTAPADRLQEDERPIHAYQWELPNGIVKSVPNMTEAEAKQALCECLDVIAEVECQAVDTIELLRKHKLSPDYPI